MDCKLLFTIGAGIATLAGASLLLAPVPLAAPEGLEPGLADRSYSRLVGVAFVAYALLAWSFRNVRTCGVRCPVAMTLFAYFAIGFVATLIIQLTLSQPPSGWLVPFVYLVLAVAFGWFRLTEAGQPSAGR